jgi:starch-binding outer membrane protein, SusD/RagB family
MRTKRTIALAAAGLISLTGCLDLEENVVTGVTARYYETPAGLEDAVRASYGALKDFYGQERDMTLYEMGTDIFTKGADGSHKFYNDYDSQLNPTASFITQYWELAYRAINTTNAVVNRAENVQGMSEALRTQRVAEARFLRALYYFNLVRTYGPVHITLEETTGVVTESARAPVAEVYSQIIADATFAEANLPVSQSDYGRATRGAAQHLLALVHLTRAEAGDMDRAVDFANRVIASPYSLRPRFVDVYDINNQRNSEVVFAVQNTVDPILNGGNGNRWHLYFLMEYDREPGMTRTIEYGRPWKRLRPTRHLLDLWDRDIDSRYEDSFQHVWYVNSPDPSRGLARGDTSIFIPAVKTAQLPDRYKNTKYRVFTEPDDFWAPKPPAWSNGSEYDYRYYPALNKHLDPMRLSINQEQGQRDFFVFRLADTYLMAAEALVRANRPEEAVPFVNAIRTRAAKPGHEAAMQVTAAQLDLDFILDERARELAGEGTRWFDLVRTGKLLERVQLHNRDAAFIQPHHVLRPIPQNQIDRTTSAFAQNPGY